MPTLRVEMFAGRTVEQKRALARELTDATVRALGVPASALLSELASTLDPARTKGEHELLAAYRNLDTRQQGALLIVARSMKPKASRK